MPAENKKVIGLILAGGKSSRMQGQDKGLLRYKNKYLVAHVIDRLAPQVESIVISCNQNQPIYQTLADDIIDDAPFPSEGPLCALAAALHKMKQDYDYLALAPCDSPLLPDDYVAKLQQALESQNADIACISTNKQIQPLFCLLKKNCLPALLAFLAQGHRKTQDWLFQQKMVLVEDDRQQLYLNINTANDLNALSVH